MHTEIKSRPVITMESVVSSQIASIGHTPESNTLAIQFPDRKDGSPGSLYHYQNFTADQFAEFKSAESIGSHFGKHIKPFADRFPFAKIS